MKNYLERFWFEMLIVTILVATTICMVFVLISERNTIYETRLACLQAGYPSYTIVGGRESFCLKIVDGTDIVVPLEDLEK